MSYIRAYEKRNGINDYTHFGALKGIPKKSRNPETIKLKLIQIIVLDVQVLKTDEVEKLTEQNIVV